MRWAGPTKAALVVVMAVAGLTGCATYSSESKGTDTAPAGEMYFPVDYPNVSYKCNGTDMVYSSTNGGMAVSPNHPDCRTPEPVPTPSPTPSTAR